MMQDRVDRIQTIVPRCQAQRRLVAKLGRQDIHVFFVDIGRIAHDKVVVPAFQLVEEAGLHEPDTVAEFMPFYVYGCDIERIGRDVDGIDYGAGESLRDGYSNTAATRTEIDRSFNVLGYEPWFEAIVDEFGEGRPGYQHTLVDIEFESGEPGLVNEIGNRHPAVNALFDQRFNSGQFACVDRSFVNSRHVVMRQPQVRKHQPGGLVHRVVRTMAEAQLGRAKSARDLADKCFDVGRMFRCLCHRRGVSFRMVGLRKRKPGIMNPRKVFIVVVSLAAITTGTWFSFQLASPPPVPATATVMPATSELPEFSLQNQHGDVIDRDVFKGQWDLLFFGFTQCPDICPLTLQVLANAQQQLVEAGQQPLPRIVFVSVDPERDTPDVVGEYISHFGDDSLGITGSIDEIRKLTNGLGIFFEKLEPDEENYSVAHSAVVLVIDPDGRFHSLFGTPHEAENFVHDLPIIMSAQ